MNKKAFKKLFKDALQGKPVSGAEHAPTSLSMDSRYLANLQEMADTLHEFSIEYSLVLEDIYNSGEHIDPELKLELNHCRDSFFSNIQKAAGLMNASMTDICHAANTDYNKLYKGYFYDSEDFDDTDVLRLCSLMHEELTILKDAYIHGGRARESLISCYLEAKPLEEYAEDPESLTP